MIITEQQQQQLLDNHTKECNDLNENFGFLCGVKKSLELFEKTYNEKDNEKDKLIEHLKGCLNSIKDVDFNSSAMGCGLEDRGITDKYSAMEYGFNAALNKVNEFID